MVRRMNGLVPGTLSAVLLVACSIVAQTPPDFSGKWTVAPSERAAGAALGSAPPTLSAQGDMSSGWAPEVTITQDASALTIVYTYFHPREMQPPFTFKYLLNGTASTNTVNMGRGPQKQTSKAAWQGTSLVITTTHHFVNPQNGQAMTAETRQKLSLESPGVLVIETTRDGVLGGRSSSTTTRYNKGEAQRGRGGA
jgi:hypothetical protein